MPKSEAPTGASFFVLEQMNDEYVWEIGGLQAIKKMMSVENIWLLELY